MNRWHGTCEKHPMRMPQSHPTESHAELHAAARRFLIVGILLFCLTATTVAVATVPALDIGEHGFDKWDALLGIMIATTKASLVALVFMHLNHERKAIYFIFGLSIIHAAGFFVGTYWHFADIPHDKHFYPEMPAPSLRIDPETPLR